MSEMNVLPFNHASVCQLANHEINQLDHTKQLRICFVVDHLSTIRNAGFTSYDLLQKLTKASCHVTLLSVHSQHIDPDFQQFCFNKCNIQLAFLNYSGPVISSLLPAVHSYHLMQWLLENCSEFDLVQFPLTGGLAYYTLLAKHQGWAFQHLVCCVDGHSATLWLKHQHQQWIDHIDDLAADFLEKESIRLADCIVTQEEKMLDWMQNNEWQLPQQVLLVPSRLDETGWLNFYRNIFVNQQQHFSRYSSLKQEDDNKPLVSICLTHFNRPQYLAQALESIRNQDYSHFEVILIDDASTQPEAIAYLDSLVQEFEGRGWKIIRNEQNLFPGAARNLAARQSKGDYLFFMDDDNYAKPHQISTFVKVAKQVNADILTCAMDVFVGSEIPVKNALLIHRFLPMGAAASIGLYFNMFGDMNALIKRKVYEALNGLTEERGIGGEDWELYSRAVLQGYCLETIPQALFWYRDTPSSITKTTHLYANSLRGIRSYLEAVPPPLREILMLSQAQQEKLQKLLIEHNHLGKLLKRCWQLFSSRACRAVVHPRQSIKKIFRYFVK